MPPRPSPLAASPSAAEAVAEESYQKVRRMPTKQQVDLLAQALLREFMHRRGFRETLQAFDAECARNEDTISSRMAMRQLLNVPPAGRTSRLKPSAAAAPLSSAEHNTGAKKASGKVVAPTLMEEVCSHRLVKREYRIPKTRLAHHRTREEEERGGAAALLSASSSSVGSLVLDEDPSDVELDRLRAKVTERETQVAVAEAQTKEGYRLLEERLARKKERRVRKLGLLPGDDVAVESRRKRKEAKRKRQRLLRGGVLGDDEEEEEGRGGRVPDSETDSSDNDEAAQRWGGNARSDSRTRNSAALRKPKGAAAHPPERSSSNSSRSSANNMSGGVGSGWRPPGALGGSAPSSRQGTSSDEEDSGNDKGEDSDSVMKDFHRSPRTSWGGGRLGGLQDLPPPPGAAVSALSYGGASNQKEKQRASAKNHKMLVRSGSTSSSSSTDSFGFAKAHHPSRMDEDEEPQHPSSPAPAPPSSSAMGSSTRGGGRSPEQPAPASPRRLSPDSSLASHHTNNTSSASRSAAGGGSALTPVTVGRSGALGSRAGDAALRIPSAAAAFGTTGGGAGGSRLHKGAGYNPNAAASSTTHFSGGGGGAPEGEEEDDDGEDEEEGKTVYKYDSGATPTQSALSKRSAVLPTSGNSSVFMHKQPASHRLVSSGVGAGYSSSSSSSVGRSSGRLGDAAAGVSSSLLSGPPSSVVEVKNPLSAAASEEFSPRGFGTAVGHPSHAGGGHNFMSAGASPEKRSARTERKVKILVD